DRLVCGDVGFGKTEIALRAAFKAAMSARQVALLCPTTILAFQHFKVFRERLAPFPLRVGMLSRFVPRKEMQKTLAAVANGTIDIVIGTHVLLSPRVRFRDLGLLIVDEEQRFGVRQKESLRALKAGVDVLTLSATPIPRTLYIALAGLRDISAIHTPPPGRREIVTEVAHWNDSLIRDYVCRELNRGGQVFFVHNEISSIDRVADRLGRLLPGAKIAVAHGQLSERRLAEIYLDFAAGKYDILLSTAIIESGLDMPNVNTIIVNRADRFGLADLHQLRGRVGRSPVQAYALFLVPDRHDVTPDARKRLSALLAYSQLGAGYKLALRDMEIRGVGNLLGTEQHGHIARIGFSLYTQLLREAVAKLKGEPIAPEPELSLAVNAFIPKEYVADQYERVALYKRLLGIQSEEELADFKTELVDRFGRYPEPVRTLLDVALIRVRARRTGVLKIKLDKNTATVVWPERTETFTGGLDALLGRLARQAG
ncbi:MAG: TRCF domain-containing protein, partial [candidate division WOR-3 bacterium]